MILWGLATMTMVTTGAWAGPSVPAKGETESAVLARLGHPNGVLESEDGTSTWSYGSFLVHFQNGRVAWTDGIAKRQARGTADADEAHRIKSMYLHDPSLVGADDQTIVEVWEDYGARFPDAELPDVYYESRDRLRKKAAAERREYERQERERAESRRETELALMRDMIERPVVVERPLPTSFLLQQQEGLLVEYRSARDAAIASGNTRDLARYDALIGSTEQRIRMYRDALGLGR
ncbi:MAG: hypothetical protein JO317_03380, partial [Verrucomicrobiae bacterium]|nr:hypothetical protein [Verrucomicrobiae bacterium]